PSAVRHIALPEPNYTVSHRLKDYFLKHFYMLLPLLYIFWLSLKRFQYYETLCAFRLWKWLFWRLVRVCIRLLRGFYYCNKSFLNCKALPLFLVVGIWLYGMPFRPKQNHLYRLITYCLHRHSYLPFSLPLHLLYPVQKTKKPLALIL